MALMRLYKNDGSVLPYNFKANYFGTSDSKGIYRPASPERIIQYISWDPRASAAESLDSACKIIAEHLVSWDVEDESNPGKTLPINEEVIRAIPHPFRNFLLDCVTNLGPKIVEQDLKN